MRYIDLYIQSTDIKPKADLSYNSVPLTSGTVNDVAVRFDFSEDWNCFESKTAIFQAGETKIAVLITDSTAIIPWEVLVVCGFELFVGVCGMSGEKENEDCHVLNTELHSLGFIKKGVELSGSAVANPPTEDIISQCLVRLGETLDIISRFDDLQHLLLSLNMMFDSFQLDTDARITSLNDKLTNHINTSAKSPDGVHGIKY